MSACKSTGSDSNPARIQSLSHVCLLYPFSLSFQALCELCLALQNLHAVREFPDLMSMLTSGSVLTCSDSDPARTHCERAFACLSTTVSSLSHFPLPYGRVFDNVNNMCAICR
jgi:hypothetical protein